MHIIDFGHDRSAAITEYGSQLARAQRLADGAGEAHVYVVHIEAGGEIGVHPAGFGQLFLVVVGTGWVAGPDGVRCRVCAGQGAVIACGERHSKGSDTGCTTIMIQLAELSPTTPPLMSEPRNPQVRQLAHDDLPKLLALYAHLHRADEPLPAQEQVEAIWRRIMRDDSHIYMGGFLGETLISACNAVVVPNLTRGARPYAVIENVVTHAAHRRTGAGTKVMRRLIDECIARACYKIMLMSSADRDSAHGFYESLGFDKKSKQAFVLKVK